MALKIDYAGLERASRRDRKLRKRQKLIMTEDGRSVKLLDKLQRERIQKVQEEDVQNLPSG